MSQFPFPAQTATEQTPTAVTTVPDGVQGVETGEAVAQPPVEGASTSDEGTNVKAEKKPRTTKAEKASKALATAKKKADALVRRYDEVVAAAEPLKARRDEALRELEFAKSNPHLPAAEPAGADQEPGSADGEIAGQASIDEA